jgi:3-hydroxyisobutyrate dehydrogenase-like beta-hydroxyacid dehydrogenase
VSATAGDRLRAGFIGLGIMGSRMAANLRAAGFELAVWNRTAATAQEWAAAHGARAFATPAEVAALSDVVITMVVDGGQVERVLLGDGGAIDGAHDDSLFVDMSTIGPTAARRIASLLAARGGVSFLDAPVTGSSPKAGDGTLTIMVGGAPEDFERARPLFEAMGKLLVYAGPVGDGQMIKLINNTVAAVNTAAAGEALLVGRKAGVDLDALVTVMSAGSGGSAMLELKHQAMRDRDYTTLFKLEHMKKDVGLFLEEADKLGAGSRFARGAQELLEAADGIGLGEQDFAAMFEALDRGE